MFNSEYDFKNKSFSEYAKINDLFSDCMLANGFMDDLKQKEDNTHGLIKLASVFNSDNFKAFNAEPINDFNYLMNAYGKWIVNNVNFDTTYNYKAPIEKYIFYTVISLVDPSHKKMSDIVLFNVSKTLKLLGEHTKNIIVVFNDNRISDTKISSDLIGFIDSNCTNSFINFIQERYALLELSFDINDKKCIGTFSANINGSDIDINVSMLNTKKHYISSYSSLDLTNNRAILGAVRDIFYNSEYTSDNFKAGHTSIKHLKLNYTC